MPDDLPLEGAPTYEQHARLSDFLTELMAISRRYGMVINAYHEDGAPSVVDVTRGTTVGMHLNYFLDAHGDGIAGYDFNVASILDGVWQVDTPQGPRDQAEVNGSRELWARRAKRQQQMRQGQ